MPASLLVPEVTISTPGSETGVEENGCHSLNQNTVNVCVQQGDPDNNNHQDLVRKRNMSHLMVCRRHTCAKSIVADPPCASKEDIVKARCKLQSINSSLQV